MAKQKSSPNGPPQQLQARLNDPEIIYALNRLLDRVDVLERAVSMSEDAVYQAPGMVAMVADSVDEIQADLLKSGTDLEIVLKHALEVASRLQNPRLANVITKLLDQADMLEQAVDALEQAPGMVAMLGDVFDEGFRQATEAGIDPEQLLQNGMQIAVKLQNPKLMQALVELLDHPEALESLVLTLEQGPGMAAMVGDIIDEFYRNVSENGMDIEIIVPQLIQIATKVQNPEMLEALNRALSQTESIEMLVSLLEQTPGMLAMTGDIVDEVYRSAVEAGVDPETVLPELLGIFVHVQNPRLLRAVNRMVADPAAVEMIASLVEQGPGTVAMVADILDEAYLLARKSGLDLDVLLSHGLEALVKFIEVVESKQFDALMASGIFDPQAVEIVGRASVALTESYQQEDLRRHRIGPIGLIKILYDPDVQRALAFLTDFGKRFGQELSHANVSTQQQR